VQEQLQESTHDDTSRWIEDREGSWSSHKQ